jgi:hypothetical protein
MPVDSAASEQPLALLQNREHKYADSDQNPSPSLFRLIRVQLLILIADASPTSSTV